jgi:hypothetical protein
MGSRIFIPKPKKTAPPIAQGDSREPRRFSHEASRRRSLLHTALHEMPHPPGIHLLPYHPRQSDPPPLRKGNLSPRHGEGTEGPLGVHAPPAEKNLPLHLAGRASRHGVEMPQEKKLLLPLSPRGETVPRFVPPYPLPAEEGKMFF